MCGICCIVQYGCSKRTDIQVINEDSSRIRNRGPDRSDCRKVQVTEDCMVQFCGHVLHLRGDKLVAQPAVDKHGNILLWNGEIFDGVQVGEHESDTEVLLSLLSQDDDDQHVLSVISQIHGPWSLIYWQACTETLWFGRDVFGRRSLLWHLPKSDTDSFVLSSVLIKPNLFTEIPSIGLFKMPLHRPPDSSNSTSGRQVYLYPWNNAVWPGTLHPVCAQTFPQKIMEGNDTTITQVHLYDQPVPCQMPKLNDEVPDIESRLPALEDESKSLDYLQTLLATNEYMRTLSRQLSQVLLEAVRKRVFNQQRNIDTANTGNKNIKLKDSSESSDEATEENGATCESVNGPMEACSLTHEPVRSLAHVAILFSGGIDSTVIAALADRCVPKNEPIDLINVAFEQKEKHVGKKKRPAQAESRSRGWDVPDRLTGHVALSELNPDRTWNFIEVNVTAEELRDMRQRHISELLYPLETVLDDSIGCAVWFAARGHGILANGDRKGQAIHSQAKVILCGMGADEQLVGYSRHRVKFKTGGWTSLLEEIKLELTRISARNLGRDDRIITDHGKESRFPFLDEKVVQFLCSLPLQDKADLSLPRGVGEKLLLRLAAVELGLLNTATLPKRAIQFGSRIAKMENSKENAADKCDRLKTEL